MTRTPARPVDRRQWIRRAGIVGVVGVLVFWATQAALHVLRSDLSVVDDYVSDYANGPWGSLFTVGTMVHGVGNLAIAAGLGYALAPVRAVHAGRAGVVLFVIATLGLIVAAIFPTDPADAPQTVTGQVHGLAASGSFAVELGALVLLAVAFSADAAWRSYLRVSLAITVTAGITLAWLLLAINRQWPPGLPERSALLAFAGWEFATAVLLARTSRSSKSARHALHRWMKMADREDGVQSGPVSDDSAKLREANKRIRLLEQEAEVMRRAVAYLSRDINPKK